VDLVSFDAVVAICAAVAAAAASVTGFGIGSIMTPLINLEVELKTAVAIVAIPHFVATAERFWRLRKDVDRAVLLSFGITSAAGGLAGAYLNTRFSSPLLTVIFGCLLVFAGLSGLTRFMQRVRFGRTFSWIAGFFSGAFGGLVGNQGGIRAAAMLTFALSPRAFVATSTAIGLIVDLARLPVYLAFESAAVFAQGRLIAWAILGVTVGTLLGVHLLSRLPAELFQKLVSALILVLGVVMICKGMIS